MFGAKDGHCSLDDHNIWLTTCCTWNPQKKADIEIFNLIFSISTGWPDFCSRKTNLELIFSHLSPDLLLPELFAPYLFWKCAPWLSTHKDEFGVANVHVWGLCGHWQQVCCCQTFGSKQVATKEDLTKILPQRVSFPTHPITGSQHLLLWTSEHQPPVPSWQLRNDSEQISIRCIAQQQEGGDFSPFERY